MLSHKNLLMRFHRISASSCGCSECVDSQESPQEISQNLHRRFQRISTEDFRESPRPVAVAQNLLSQKISKGYSIESPRLGAAAKNMLSHKNINGMFHRVSTTSCGSSKYVKSEESPRPDQSVLSHKNLHWRFRNLHVQLR